MYLFLQRCKCFNYVTYAALYTNSSETTTTENKQCLLKTRYVTTKEQNINQYAVSLHMVRVLNKGEDKYGTRTFPTKSFIQFAFHYYVIRYDENLEEIKYIKDLKKINMS